MEKLATVNRLVTAIEVQDVDEDAWSFYCAAKKEWARIGRKEYKQLKAKRSELRQSLALLTEGGVFLKYPFMKKGVLCVFF